MKREKRREKQREGVVVIMPLYDEGEERWREGEGGIVSRVGSTTMHRQVLHHYARSGKNPRIKREQSGGCDKQFEA
jgi:hypothetical protein